MLRDDLKEVQRKRKYLYKIMKQYLTKMGNKELMTLNDYFNMIQLTKEVELLDIESKEIVRKIIKGGN